MIESKRTFNLLVFAVLVTAVYAANVVKKQNCQRWYDGCNDCVRNTPESIFKCTLRECAKVTEPYCKEAFEKEAIPIPQRYNCFSREVWPPKKQEWCCKHMHLGCPAKVIRNERTLDESSDKENCQVWFDGCNTCVRANRIVGFSCTDDSCEEMEAPYCKKFLADSKTHNCYTNDEDIWTRDKRVHCCRYESVGCPLICRSDDDCRIDKTCYREGGGARCVNQHYVKRLENRKPPPFKELSGPADLQQIKVPEVEQVDQAKLPEEFEEAKEASVSYFIFSFLGIAAIVAYGFYLRRYKLASKGN